jgi:hypothetical protein
MSYIFLSSSYSHIFILFFFRLHYRISFHMFLPFSFFFILILISSPFLIFVFLFYVLLFNFSSSSFCISFFLIFFSIPFHFDLPSTFMLSHFLLSVIPSVFFLISYGLFHFSLLFLASSFHPFLSIHCKCRDFLLYLITHTHHLRLPWMRDRPVARNSTRYLITLVTNRHPCLGWIRIRNPRKQADTDTYLRLCGHWDRTFVISFQIFFLLLLFQSFNLTHS